MRHRAADAGLGQEGPQAPHQFRLSLGAGHAEDLAAELLVLPRPSRLRPLVAAGGERHIRAHHRRRALRAQDQPALTPVLEVAGLPLHHIRGVAAAGDQLSVLERGSPHLAESAAPRQIPRQSLPASGRFGEHILGTTRSSDRPLGHAATPPSENKGAPPLTGARRTRGSTQIPPRRSRPGSSSRPGPGPAAIAGCGRLGRHGLG